MGMRAATGAIAEAVLKNGRLDLHVLGDVTPRGICGSGLVDIVAAGLDLGQIAATGRFSNGSKEWLLAEPVKLLQRDIRELQLAKGAVAAGIRILLNQLGTNGPEKVYLAGAFGNYVSHTSSRRIGLFDFPLDRVVASGNTALLGAKIALFRTSVEERDFTELRSMIKHVRLADDPSFEETYVDCMNFPTAR